MIKNNMIQLKTLFLNVADNIGAHELMCIWIIRYDSFECCR